MAKTSMIEREKRRAKLVKRYAAKRAELKETIRSPKSTDDGARGGRSASCSALPRDAVALAAAQSLRDHRPPARRVPQVRPRPHQAARGHDARRDPGPAQGQLVRPVTEQDMSMTDPIADFLTRIRNGQRSGKTEVSMPALADQAGASEGAEGRGLHRRLRRRRARARKATLTLRLKYYQGRPVIDRLERVSRPGLRVYQAKDELPRCSAAWASPSSRRRGRDDGPRGAGRRPRRRSPLHRVLTHGARRRIKTMSRVAKKPVPLPKGVTAASTASPSPSRARRAALTLPLRPGLSPVRRQRRVEVAARKRESLTHAGRPCAPREHGHGRHEGLREEARARRRRLPRRRAGQNLNLTLGFSHPVEYPVPEGITIETPSQTEIMVKGADDHRSVRWRRICATTGRRSPTRARASSTRTSESSSKKRRRSKGVAENKASRLKRARRSRAKSRSSRCVTG